jgi:hypothetical protein
MLSEQGFDRRSAPGPRYWRIPDGRTLVQVADDVIEPVNAPSVDEIIESDAPEE